MLKLLEAEEAGPGVLDNAFIQDKTSGYEAFRADLERYRYEELVERTGLDPADVEQLVRVLSGRSRIITCWSMGLTQHKNGVDNIRELVNLLLLKGSIGKPGAGTCPVRGHSNVQGDRTMGIHERPPKKLLDAISKNFGFTPPADHGYSVVEAIEAMDQGKVRFFFALGGNFFTAAPDTVFTAQAMRKCHVTAHVSTKLNRSHLVHGRTALILPCLGRTDKQPDQTVENSMGVVHSTRGALTPPSATLLTEVAIVCRLARAALPDSTLEWQTMENDYTVIRRYIEKTIEGFENFSDKARSGFELYNGARVGVFHTPDARAHFTVNQPAADESQYGKYLMMTIRSHDQFNTTVYGLDDRYRGVFGGRRVVFMNREDMQAEGLNQQDVVHLVNHYPPGERRVEGLRVVPYEIPRGCLATYYPETNPLVPISEYAHTSLTPASKSVRVDVVRP
jgi:molybdopterin-dependent oxidoreductase alpha subunit